MFKKRFYRSDDTTHAEADYIVRKKLPNVQQQFGRHGFTFKTDDNSRDFTQRFLLLLSTISLCSAEQRIFLKIQRTHRRRRRPF